MVMGYYSITEVTIDTDIELYYGPTKAVSVPVHGGRFRLHLLPDNIKSILIVSRDFAGITVNREDLYSVEEALNENVIQPLKMSLEQGAAGGLFKTLVPGAVDIQKSKFNKHKKSKIIKRER